MVNNQIRQLLQLTNNLLLLLRLANAYCNQIFYVVETFHRGRF